MTARDSNQYRPFALIGLAVTGILAGAVLGALTNCINGLVSPLYFCNILGWHDVDDVWRASIAQGIFEGLIFGLFLALVFTIVVGCVSKARCSYRFGVGTLLFVAIAARSAGRSAGFWGWGWRPSARSSTAMPSLAYRTNLGRCSATPGLAARSGGLSLAGSA